MDIPLLANCIFMLFLFPLLIIGGSCVMKMSPAKQKNLYYGYRTPRSMKNQSNWDYAQQLAPAIMLWQGVAVLIAGCLLFIICYMLHDLLAFLISYISVLLLSLIPLFVVIETKLKKFEGLQA